MDEIGKTMTSKKESRTIAIILLVALVLLYLPIPFINGREIAALGILGTAIYLLIKG